ncbi:transcriptional regulator [Bradyrhizobium sp. 199]|uniref:transcriptional regulator n=1 Tax=Bradyrhizobium sp. 199 TaxID=2782664 RepID=UPI001FF71AF3|nr:transcriptional regulator [Bradyrhizobium sp. 199]MCK1358436.1 transcriptional regulator [Bradyrhizobium sp. 199]
MSTKKPAPPSPESVARSDRRRLAAEDGAQAMADAERQAIDVRKNMARLRAAREAKEAADEALRLALPAPAPKKRSRKPAR